MLGDPQRPDTEIELSVRAQLSRWLDRDLRAWKLLRIYRIRNAHPARTPETVQEQPVRLKNDVFVCGDHRFMPSIQAALVNGRHAAEAVAERAR